jgi:hypothetical protein
MNDALGLASILLALWGSPTQAATGSGEFHYGPETSENYACAKAEQLAKIEAIRSVIGENLYADEFSQCKDRNGEIQCAYDVALFSTTDAFIRGVKKSKRYIDNSSVGGRICTVHVDVIVSDKKPKVDAFVEGRFMYKHGDNMIYRVKTNSPTKVFVFHTEGKKATMMWPAFYGTNNYVANELVFPTQGYKITALASKAKLPESLVFVFTNEDVNFMRDYDVDDLNNKLLALKIEDRRIIRRNLVIEQ